MPDSVGKMFPSRCLPRWPHRAELTRADGFPSLLWAGGRREFLREEVWVPHAP